jgi:hypothetical protein
MQMRSKRAANRSASQEDVDDDSSSGEEQYVIQPQLRCATRKTHASSSRAAAEAATRPKDKLCEKQGKQGLVALFSKFSIHSSLTMSTLLEEWIIITLTTQLTIQGARISP